MMRKAAILSVAFLVLVGVGAGAVPRLDVEPGSVDLTGNDSVKANRGHDINFTFTNLNDTRRIYEVELEDRDWLTWNGSVNGSLVFDLNASANRTVLAEVNPPSPGLVNETFEVPYRYNNSGDFTSDSNFFPEVAFLVESSWVESEISTNIFTTDFTLELGQADNSVYQIVNEGNETAYTVESAGKYIEFDRQGFNLSVGDDEFVGFTVEIPKPSDPVVATNKTNRTYMTNITVSGENFDSEVIPISVHVPFKEYEPDISENGSLSGLLDSFERFCRNNPGECNVTRTVVRNQTVVQNTTPVYQANLTSEQLEALANLSLEELNQDEATRHEIQLLKNLVSYRLDRINDTFSKQMQRALNMSSRALNESQETQQAVYSEQEVEEQGQENARSAGMMVLTVLMVGGVLVGGGYGAYNWYRKRQDNRLIA